MTVLLVIIAVATFIAVLSYLAGDRHVMYSSVARWHYLPYRQNIPWGVFV